MINEAQNMIIQQALKREFPNLDVFVPEYPFGCVWRWDPNLSIHKVSPVQDLKSSLGYKGCINFIKSLPKVIFFNDGKAVITRKGGEQDQPSTPRKAR